MAIQSINTLGFLFKIVSCHVAMLKKLKVYNEGYVRLKFSRGTNVTKSSRAISRVNAESKTNVSETSSVSIIRVTDPPERIFNNNEGYVSK
jgi:hypothetical protein